MFLPKTIVIFSILRKDFSGMRKAFAKVIIGAGTGLAGAISRGMVDIDFLKQTHYKSFCNAKVMDESTINGDALPNPATLHVRAGRPKGKTDGRKRITDSVCAREFQRALFLQLYEARIAGKKVKPTELARLSDAMVKITDLKRRIAGRANPTPQPPDKLRPPKKIKSSGLSQDDRPS